MTDPTTAEDLAFALALAADADLVSLDRFQAMDLRVETKPDRTPVTDADQAVERVIRERIAASRPNDGILGEESGTEGGARRAGVSGPRGGSGSLRRGVPIWGTLIALAVDGVPVVGVVSCPALGRRWWGATGLGAWGVRSDTDGAPEQLGVSGVRDLADASFNYNSIQGWDLVGRLDQLVGITRDVWRARAIGDVWSYMLLAEGSVDAVAEFDLKPYDMAAIVPIVLEAGGRFTDADGNDGPWGGAAVATNTHLHEVLLERMR